MLTNHLLFIEVCRFRECLIVVSNKILLLIVSTLLALGCNASQEKPDVIIISADGNYTGSVLHRSISVMYPKGEVEGRNFSFSGTLVNKSLFEVSDLKLVIDFYNEVHMPFYQCTYYIDKSIKADDNLVFRGRCDELPNTFAERFRSFRIVVSKQ